MVEIFFFPSKAYFLCFYSKRDFQEHQNAAVPLMREKVQQEGLGIRFLFNDANHASGSFGGHGFNLIEQN